MDLYVWQCLPVPSHDLSVIVRLLLLSVHDYIGYDNVVKGIIAWLLCKLSSNFPDAHLYWLGWGWNVAYVEIS